MAGKRRQGAERVQGARERRERSLDLFGNLGDNKEPAVFVRFRTTADFSFPVAYREICNTAISISIRVLANPSSARDWKTLRPVASAATHTSERK